MILQYIVILIEWLQHWEKEYEEKGMSRQTFETAICTICSDSFQIYQEILEVIIWNGDLVSGGNYAVETTTTQFLQAEKTICLRLLVSIG